MNIFTSEKPKVVIRMNVDGEMAEMATNVAEGVQVEVCYTKDHFDTAIKGLPFHVAYNVPQKW